VAAGSVATLLQTQPGALHQIQARSPPGLRNLEGNALAQTSLDLHHGCCIRFCTADGDLDNPANLATGVPLNQISAPLSARR